jgi:hypothetical protein
MREFYVDVRLVQSGSTRWNSTVKPCPCAVAGAVLTKWCHCPSAVVDPLTGARRMWVPRSVTRDFRSTQPRAAPVVVTIQEMQVRSLIQVKGAAVVGRVQVGC